MNILTLNSGSNSLKFEIVSTSGSTESEWLERGEASASRITLLADIDSVAHRVVHGADRSRGAWRSAKR